MISAASRATLLERAIRREIVLFLAAVLVGCSTPSIDISSTFPALSLPSAARVSAERAARVGAERAAPVGQSDIQELDQQRDQTLAGVR
jgi:hypothetical protein